MGKVGLIYTTVANEEDAENIAKSAIHEKLATCVNIVPQAKSIYLWEGEVKKSAECLMLFKTSSQKMNLLNHWLRTNHPYIIPALLSGEIEGSFEFCKYVNANTV